MDTVSEKRVALIIPYYNKFAMLAQCLHTVIVNSSPDDVRYVVVDDLVESKISEKVQELCNQFGADYYRTPKNVGFLGATTLGAANTKEPFILFLNSDIVVEEYGFVDAMLESMLDDPKIAVMGAKLVFPNHTIQHAGVARMDGGQPYHPFMHSNGDLEAANIYRDNINAVTGACFMIRRTVWEETHGWDPGFGLGVYEDVGFCWEVRKRGWKVACQPAVSIIHHQSASIEVSGSHRLHDHSRKNLEYLLSKWKDMESDEHLFGLPKGGGNLDIVAPPFMFPMFDIAQRGNGVAAFVTRAYISVPVEQRELFAKQLFEMVQVLSQAAAEPNFSPKMDDEIRRLIKENQEMEKHAKGRKRRR